MNLACLFGFLFAISAVACGSNSGSFCGAGTKPGPNGCERGPDTPARFRVCGPGTRYTGTECVPAVVQPSEQDGGAGGSSNSADASNDTSPPDVPDEAPPVFGGALWAESASDSSIRVTWDPARDDRSSEVDLVYRIFVATTSGGEDYGTSPALVASPGATSTVVGGLEHAPARYYFVVRARDAAGNEDDNTHEVTAAAGYDQVPPLFAGCDTVTEATKSEIHVTWDTAVDASTPHDSIEYRIWISESASGASAHDREPDKIVRGATEVTFASVERGHRYYFYCEAADYAGNVDGNQTTPDILFDDPPSFADYYLVTFENVATTSFDVLWPPAQDDATPPEGMVYTVDILAPSLGTTVTKEMSPGVTRLTLTGLEPWTGYQVTVHARDHSGQVDATSTTGNVATYASFSRNIQPSFTATCATSGCHDATTAAAGLVLTEGRSYAALINVKATQPALYGVDMVRVSPGDPNQSFLTWKLVSPNYGMVMPPDGSDAQWLRYYLQDWIFQGALDN